MEKRGEKELGILKFAGRIRWIGFVAARYVSRGRRNSPSPVLAILGIATGVLALTVILAVMNGFQLGFIESILEISSCHLRVESFPAERAAELADRIMEVPGTLAAVPFREFQGLIRGSRETQHGAVVRGLPPDALERDAGMKGRLQFEAGSFDLSDPRSILIGAELARQLSVRPGDGVTLFSITGILSSGAEEDEDAGSGIFIVRGVFRTGFYEYDAGWSFIDIGEAERLSGADMIMGVKLKNRWQDRQTLALVKEALAGREDGAGPLKFSTWQDYNRAFFGALRTEKLFMFLLVGLIFIVVGLNIFQSQRRSVLEHREDIGLFRAVGAAGTAVRLVFVWDGVIIGFTGALSGMCLGLLVASHVSLFFTALEGLVNFFIGIVNGLLSLAGFSRDAGEFAIFSPAVFYIKEIPSRIIAREVVIVFMFGFLSALFAAWFASGKVARTGPAEVLRYE
jgi:lipoprotein-releasing system permease protein